MINENFKEIGRNSLCWINTNVQPRECCDTRNALKDAFNQVGHWMGNSEEIVKCNDSEKSALCYAASAQTFQNETVPSTLPTTTVFVTDFKWSSFHPMKKKSQAEEAFYSLSLRLWEYQHNC